MNAHSVHGRPCGDPTRAGGDPGPDTHHTSCQVEIRATFADRRRYTWECEMTTALDGFGCVDVVDFALPPWFWREVFRRLLASLDEPATTEVPAP